jgi:ABC-2 type transport system permease protein
MTSPTTATYVAPTAVSTLAVFARTCAAEWTRLWTVRTSRWSLLAAAVVMLGLGSLLGFEAAADPVELQGEPAWQTAQFIAMPTQFALLAFALLGVTSDYATGGIVPTLQWTPRRTVLFFARTVVTVGVATGAGVLLALAAGTAAFTTSSSALTLELDAGLDMAGTVAFVLAAGTALAVGLGFLLRNTAGALVTVFLVVLVLPLLLPVFGAWMTRVAELLPGSGVTYLLLGEPQDRMTQTSAITVLLAWALGSLVLGWLRLARDDANR